ncbi:MAG: TIGR02301 family protein [Hyphomicrobium sp.]|nr:TIGR02301 family protein [Hyphomicrobium sp.]
MATPTDKICSARRRFRAERALRAFAAATLLLAALPAHAAPDIKPYDDKLLRLAEILGAVHYLRELCSANEGQYWRDRMRELTDAEGTSALRRAKLARAFNQGYRSYSRTYNTCSPSAQTVITRFLAEGTQLSEGLVKSFP